MKIFDILRPDNVSVMEEVASKRDLLQILTQNAAKTCKVDARTLFDVVLERESLGSTAFGKGTALPHGRIPELSKTIAVFAKVTNGVDFEAGDEKSVDLVFMLLSPENSGADHLQALAEISAVLRNENLCAKLRKATTADEIYKILIK